MSSNQQRSGSIGTETTDSAFLGDAGNAPTSRASTDRSRAGDRDVYKMRHTTLTLEEGEAGILARIDHAYRGRDYAGPFDDPDELRAALREVSVQ